MRGDRPRDKQGTYCLSARRIGVSQGLALLHTALFENAWIVWNPVQKRKQDKGENHPGEELRLPDNGIHKGAFECSRFPGRKQVCFAQLILANRLKVLQSKG